MQMRSREEMVERAAALFAVAVYSEVILSEDADREKALFYFNKMNDLYGSKSYLTTKETAYINDPKPERQTCILHFAFHDFTRQLFHIRNVSCFELGV